MIDQNLAHRAGGDPKEVIFVQDARLHAQQLQEQFADQGGGLQSVSGALAPQQSGRDPAQSLKGETINGFARDVIA